jgi:hypothetical protein
MSMNHRVTIGAHDSEVARFRYALTGFELLAMMDVSKVLSQFSVDRLKIESTSRHLTNQPPTAQRERLPNLLLT